MKIANRNFVSVGSRVHAADQTDVIDDTGRVWTACGRCMIRSSITSMTGTWLRSGGFGGSGFIWSTPSRTGLTACHSGGSPGGETMGGNDFERWDEPARVLILTLAAGITVGVVLGAIVFSLVAGVSNV